jgi:hypothetical protein
MAITLSLLALAASTAWAGDLTIPFPDFVGGTPAVADQVDANFAAVKEEVDDNDSRITTNAGGISTNASNITANRTDIVAINGSLPIAFAYIDSNRDIISGTSNVSSVWNLASEWYEIIINGETYNLGEYVTVVTPIASSTFPIISTVWSSSDDEKLIVELWILDGSKVQEDFQFVTFKP